MRFRALRTAQVKSSGQRNTTWSGANSRLAADMPVSVVVEITTWKSGSWLCSSSTSVRAAFISPRLTP